MSRHNVTYMIMLSIVDFLSDGGSRGGSGGSLEYPHRLRFQISYMYRNENDTFANNANPVKIVSTVC